MQPAESFVNSSACGPVMLMLASVTVALVLVLVTVAVALIEERTFTLPRSSGFGVMVMPRGRAIRNNLAIWEDSPLPELPDLYCAIFVREGGDRTVAPDAIARRGECASGCGGCCGF